MGVRVGQMRYLSIPSLLVLDSRSLAVYGRRREAPASDGCPQANFRVCACGVNLVRDLRDAALCSQTFPFNTSVWCDGF